MEEENWVEFWRSRSYEKHRVWQKNADIFLKASEPILKYNEEDIVLDFGSGLGYLSERLSCRVKEVHCADINDEFLNLCKHRLLGNRNVFFHKINEEDYLNFDFLEAEKFTKIICLSVIQYFRGLDEVEKLFQNLGGLVRKDGLLMIADIPIVGKKLNESMSMIRFGFEQKCILDIFGNLLRMSFSDYRKVRSKVGILKFSIEQLNLIIRRLGLNGSLLKDKLTVNENRIHLLIRF